MSLPLLTIISAGAGSGKTYTIQKELAKWVKQGLQGGVRPERIMAVTFTEAAAAELRSRIRAELVKEGHIEDALKLDQAYISTIHGFGFRIITEFSFEGGLSPQPRLLNEDEKDILIRLALARTDRADDVLKNLSEFGYDYDFNSGEGAEDQFRGRVLRLIEKLRSVGRFEGDSGLVPYALKSVEKQYGPTDSEAVVNKALHDAVISLLKSHPGDLSGPYAGNSALAERKFKQDFRNLKRAEKKENIKKEWWLWQELQDLRLTKRGAPTPPGYDNLAQTVMDAAGNLSSHPGPLRDAKRHVEGLLAGSQDALGMYAEDKRDKGLVDYSDMVAIARKTIAARPDIVEELKNRIDCMVIDEFQDTNPLQFSLLWALQKAKVPTLIVGDLKQAIMGFQDADSRLLEQLQKQFSAESRPLTANWRSSKQLMKWINKVGAGLFGVNYTELAAKADFESKMDPLEVIRYTVRPDYDKAAIPAQYAALRIKELLDDPKTEVYDKAQKKHRKLQGGDIAVLCPTHKRLAAYRDALNELGIRTRIEQDKWFESTIVQIAFHALSFVADPMDGHAALYLAVSQLGHYEMEDALRDVVNGKALAEPFLDRLRGLSTDGEDKTVDVLVGETITAMNLYGVTAFWGEGAQARANLLRLQGEAREFMSANREALTSGGIYGSGLKTFLSWLIKKKDVDKGNAQPSVRAVDEEAVTLATWHSSKGREWPVVAVCALAKGREPELPSFDVEYEDFSDLARILDKAKIAISPDFEAKEAAERFRGPLRDKQRNETLRLLYVALTRAREKIIMEWPEYLDPDKNSYWNTLTATTGMALVEGNIEIGRSKFSCIVTNGGRYNPAAFDSSKRPLDDKLPVIGRRAIIPGKMPERLTPEAVTPSSLHDEEPKKLKGLVTETYGTGVELEGILEPIERGKLLHRCFEVLAQRELGIEPLRNATEYAFTETECQSVKVAVADFGKFLEKNFSPVSLAREVPILALNKDGSVVSGVVDLIVETARGIWIFDHKTDTSDDIDMNFGNYARQLEAYKESIENAMKGKKVLGVGINWVKNGKVTLSQL